MAAGLYIIRYWALNVRGSVYSKDLRSNTRAEAWKDMELQKKQHSVFRIEILCSNDGGPSTLFIWYRDPEGREHTREQVELGPHGMRKAFDQARLELGVIPEPARSGTSR